jgi:glycosyltransferase involved in cell wall biosynthesis
MRDEIADEAAAITGPDWRLVNRRAAELASCDRFELGRDAVLDIVGDGAERAALEARAGMLGIADRVNFHGWLAPDRSPECFHRADVLINASPTETFGIALLEAFGHGVPVIGAAAMATPELVRDGKNGLLFPPGDRDAAAVAPGDAYNPARFGDLAAYKAEIAGYQAAYEKQFAEERALAN